MGNYQNTTGPHMGSRIPNRDVWHSLAIKTEKMREREGGGTRKNQGDGEKKNIENKRKKKEKKERRDEGVKNE
jgi:hypothetical protein